MNCDLNELKTITHRIKQLETQLEEWNVRAERIGGFRAGDRVQGGDRLELEAILDQISGIKAELMTNYKMQTQLVQEFQRRCTDLPSRYAIVLTYRYMDGKNLDRIARLMNYSRPHTQRLIGEAVRAFYAIASGEA